MADYSELKRKAQEIRDEVKAGANTANRVGIAIGETINALEAENVRAVAKEGSLQNDIQSINERIQDLGDIREGVGELQEDVTEQGKELNSLLPILEGKLDIKDLGSGLRPDQAVSEIISYVRNNNIKSALVFKYIDTDNSSTFGICISRTGVSGWILYLVARKGIEVLKYNSYGSRETWNEYGGVLRHSLNSVADEQLECLSIKGLKTVLITKQDKLAPGDGVTMVGNTISTLIGDGLAYNGREMVVSHDATLKTTEGKLGVNVGHGLFFTPDNNLGVRTGRGLAINHDDGTVEVAKEVFDEIGAKAPLDGYTPKLKVKYSEELVGRDGQTEEARIGELRATGGSQLSIGDGNATIAKIKGESVVWNQFVGSQSDITKYRANNCTLTSIQGYITATRIVEKGWSVKANGNVQFISPIVNHKLLIMCDIKTSEEGKLALFGVLNSGAVARPNFSTTISLTSSWKTYHLFTPAWSVNNDYGIPSIGGLFDDTYVTTIDFKNFVLYDLTLMFGAGNEPATIEEFEARKPLGVTNEYNEGEIISYDGDALKSVGFNAWDGDRETGDILSTNGKETNDTTVWRSGFIKVIPNEKYIAEAVGYEGNELRTRFYTSDKTYISSLDALGESVSCGGTIIIPANAGYMRIAPILKKIPYDTPICIHLVHSGYRNGEYEPYKDDTLALPNIKYIKDNDGDTLFPYGLLSAGSVHDEITATKAIKRIGVVDLGSIKWETSTSNGSIYMSGYGNSNPIIRTIKATPTASALANLMTIPYQVGSATGLIASGDKKIARNANVELGSLYVYDTDYTDATTFTQAMQGVLLYYELAEPIEVDLPEPLNMTYEAWDFGTEELIADTPTTPMDADIAYVFNAVDRIRENSKHTTEAEGRLAELERMVTELQTQLTNLTTGNE